MLGTSQACQECGTVFEKWVHIAWNTGIRPLRCGVARITAAHPQKRSFAGNLAGVRSGLHGQ